MSDETTLGKEPIELVEIILPRCANTYGVAPCTAAAGTGAECYNCRATCQDVDAYRDTPDRNLVPDATYTQGETVAAVGTNGEAQLFAAFKVRFASDPEGIIWEQGEPTRGAYLGVSSGGNLVFKCVSDGSTAEITVDAAQFVGASLTLYVEIDYAASPTATTLRLWVFDPVELSLTLLGTDTLTTSLRWASDNAGGIGLAGDTVGAGGENTNWNGDVTEADFYFDTNPGAMEDAFNASLWLGFGVAGEPSDEKYILPCLRSVSTVGTRINLSAADDNYQPLGRRATLDFAVKDFAHSDITQDPYLGNRLADPRKKSTFWRKWLVRQKYGKVGARVRRYIGYAGQRLAQYQKTSYILERVNRTEDGLSFYCRDELSRTEFNKTKVPAVSSGTLALDLDSTATTFDLSGDVTPDYPATGTVRINDEIMTYTGRSYVDPVTTFTGVTRGTDGSEADEHDASDLVQICRRYVDATIDDVLKEWWIDDSGIPAQLIDVEGLEDEVDSYLDAYRINTLLTVPTGVDRLTGQLSENASFYVCWNERDQKIITRAIRAVSADDLVKAFTYERDIIQGSFRVAETPKQRLNVVNFYYNPINYADDLNSPANFKSGLQVSNGTTSAAEQYGNIVQERDIFAIFTSTEAEANQTASRLSIRYADVPLYAEFLADAKDRSVWVADFVSIEHPLIVDQHGENEKRRWVVVEAEEIDPGHMVRYICADVTLDGTIYKITENGVGTYTPELLESGLAFITDNDGLNSDGTPGATIS